MDLVMEDTTLSISAYVQMLARYIHRQHMGSSVNLKSFNPKPRYFRPDVLANLPHFNGLMRVDGRRYTLPQLRQRGILLDPSVVYHQYSGQGLQILTHLRNPFGHIYLRWPGEDNWRPWPEITLLGVDIESIEQELKHLDC